jgi:CheY-like chemotaxis protein
MNERRRRILIAEDDRFLRKAAEVTLSRLGYTVFTAVDGEEALRIAGEELPDLVLLDLIMPKMQGFQVLRTLKSMPETRNIPVIVLSNLSQERDRRTAILDGAVNYLVKANLSLDELAETVQRTFQEGEAQ